MRDFYEILGIDRQADAEEIKTAYRKLAKNYHPDRNPGDAWAERRFKEASEAYETLGDDALRAEYDAELALFRDGAEEDSAEAFQNQRFWERDAGPAAGPPEPEPDFDQYTTAGPSWAAPWKVAVAASSLLLVLGLVFLLALVPGDPEPERIAAEPPNATAPPEPATEAAAPSEPEPQAPAAKDDDAAPAESLPASEAESEWAAVRDSRDPAELARFAERRPESSQAREAEAAIADLVAAETQEAPLEALLREFPAGVAGESARARLDEIRKEDAAAEDTAWESARQGPAKALIEFLADHPATRRAAEAKARLEGLGYIEAGVDRPEKGLSRWLRPSGVFRDCAGCPLMVVARAAKTGADDFDGRALAALPGPFAASRFRVSPKEWEECVRERACEGGASRRGEAASGLSWSDARAYVRWLRKRTGREYRLLTEKEWRYAARLKLMAIEPAAGSGFRAVDPAEPGVPASPPVEDGLLEWVSDCWAREPGPAGDEAPCASHVLVARRGRAFERQGDVSGSRWVGYTFRVARGLD